MTEKKAADPLIFISYIIKLNQVMKVIFQRKFVYRWISSQLAVLYGFLGAVLFTAK